MNNQATESSIANVFKFEDVPPIGEYWEGQGGYYGGIVRDGEHQWHLIMTSHALSDIEWGKYGNEIAGQFSRRDGLHNTQLILAGEPENAAAKFITSVNADGHGDCYWPSQGEQDLLNLNLPEHTDGKCYWSKDFSAANSNRNARGYRQNIRPPDFAKQQTGTRR
jgi:hypothetical protein